MVAALFPRGRGVARLRCCQFLRPYNLLLAVLPLQDDPLGFALHALVIHLLVAKDRRRFQPR
jgi:hypothetical protein